MQKINKLQQKLTQEFFSEVNQDNPTAEAGSSCHIIPDPKAKRNTNNQGRVCADGHLQRIRWTSKFRHPQLL